MAHTGAVCGPPLQVHGICNEYAGASRFPNVLEESCAVAATGSQFKNIRLVKIAR